MSSHTTDYLVLFGTIALTVGTAGQAAKDLAGFSQYARTAGSELREAIKGGSRTTGRLLKRPWAAIFLVTFPGVQAVFLVTAGLSLWLGLAKLRSEDADEAAHVVGLLLSGLFWSIIMVGSALTLWAAAIQV